MSTPDLSLIVPVFNEEAGLNAFMQSVCGVMDRTGLSWEIVFIDDGSTDATLACLKKIQAEISKTRSQACVIVIEFSRNFGKEAALSAGIDHARGAAAIPLDADMQDPPELIPDLVDQWRQGFDVVNAVRKTRRGESWAKRVSAHLFYRLIGKVSSIDIPADTGDFRLISRQVLDVLKTLPERRRFMKGIFAWVGFKTANVYYDRPNRYAGKTSWNYLKLFHFAVEGITSFSTTPLRICTYLGLLVAVVSLVYSAFVIVKTIVWGDPVAGYPSLMVVILFLGAVQLIALGIIGEYLGRVYEETKQRPIYVLRRIYRPDDQ